MPGTTTSKYILEVFSKISKYILFAVALTPLIYTNKTFYPFILAKTVFFRGLVEIALFFALVYVIAKVFYKKPLVFPNFKKYLKNPLIIFLSIFFISIILSTIFAVDKYAAFWGTLERGGGFWGEIHYYIFFVLALALFAKRDWRTFFKISSIVGLLMIFYGFLQYFGFVNWPFALEGQPRPGSFVGNSSFFGAYLFFVLAFSILLIFLEKTHFWRFFGFLVGFLSLIMIFLTATRGAIFGLGIGVLSLLIFFTFSKRQSGNQNSKKIRIISFGLLILFILSAVIFVATRTSSFWQNIQGLNRLARPNLIDPNDGSVQARLMAWQSGFTAFRERPIFGWGIDNYFLIWNKYYNPANSFSGETWLDRAHNKLVDVLVMQGLFGAVVYLGFYFALLYVLFKKRPLGNASPFIAAILISYFIQNLFLFDEINSYLFFFAITAFVIVMTVNVETEGEFSSDTKTENALVPSEISNIKKTIFYIFGFGICVLILFCFYFYNFIPYRQGRDILFAQGGQKDFVKTQLIRSFYPSNFVQPSIRGYITDFYYQNQPHIFESDDFKMLQTTVLDSLNEVIDFGPRDPRFYIRKSQILDLMAIKDPALYLESEKAARNASELAPNRQEVRYPLALSLAKQDRFDEAIALARETIALSPNVARPHYYLALFLSSRDIKKNRVEILDELDKVNKFAPTLENLQQSDIKQMSDIYFNLSEYDRLVDLIMKRIDGKTGKDFESQYYEFILRYFITKRDLGNLVKTAEFLSKEFPDAKNDMEAVIDLAKKGLWNVLDNLE